MAFIGEIAAHLRAENSDFRTKLNESEKAVDTFDKKLKKFGLGFGGIGALALAFRAIVDHARELEGPLDANQRRAKDFAAGIDEAKKGILDLGVKATGVVNGFGEWIGRMAAIVRHGREQVELAEQIENQTRETLAAQEKNRAVIQEVARLRAQTAEVEKRSTEEANKRLSLDQRMDLVRQRIYHAEVASQQAGEDKVEIAKIDLELAHARSELQKLEAERAKQIAAEEKKAAEEAQKSAERRRTNLEEIQKLRFDALPIEEKILTYVESIETLERLILEGKKQKVAVDEYELALLENQNELTRLRKEHADALANAERAVTREIKTQTEEMQRQVNIRRTGRDNPDLSDPALQEKIRNITQDIQQREDRLRASNGTFSDPFLQLQRNELQKSTRELRERRTVQDLVARYGEEGAAKRFSGSQIDFERLLNFANPPDAAKRTADRLDEINQRLRNSGLFNLNGPSPG